MEQLDLYCRYIHSGLVGTVVSMNRARHTLPGQHRVQREVVDDCERGQDVGGGPQVGQRGLQARRGQRHLSRYNTPKLIQHCFAWSTFISTYLSQLCLHFSCQLSSPAKASPTPARQQPVVAAVIFSTCPAAVIYRST